MSCLISLVCVAYWMTLLQLSCQQQFTQGQIPSTFTVGTYFPTRSGLNALQTEEAICRPIVDHIDRNSARFRTELVTNTNSKISFATADSRIMSSRMQSRLDRLADLYTSGRMTIRKAWSQYPDPQLAGVNSLHFEGRTVSIQLSSSGHYDAFLKLAIQATFDWVYYESSSPRRVRLSVIPSSCERNIDAVFMLDRSGSVGRTNHGITLNFIRTAVSFFTIGRSFSHVGVVAYASSSSIQFDLDDYTTLSTLQNAISQVPYTGGGTNTPASLDHARFLLTPSNNRGARPTSVGVPKVAILITDGKSNRGDLNSAITRIRNTDTQVYVVGIGNIDITELRAIATDPDNEHVFILRNYLDAAGFVDILSATTCNTPAVVDPGDNVTTDGPGGGVNYFLTSCSIFSNKVLLELIDISGTSFLFASSTVTNPGPLTSNTQSNTTIGINRRTVTVTLTGSSKVVYIGIQGQTEIARFTILVWDQLFNPVDAFIDVIEGAHAGETIYEVSRNLTSATSGNTYAYSFIEGNDDRIFSIDPNNGRVFIPTTGSPGVNFNRQRTHNLTVMARNVNHNCQIARIRINIRVISNRITFTSIPILTLMETVSVGTQVVQVVATGGAGSIQYSIVGGNNAQRFRINSNTGRLILDRTLNYETTQSYTIRVRAVSVGTTVSGEINININVQDVNEQPFFTTTCATQTSGCSYSIAENTAASTLGIIMANDPDLSTVPNGMLIYQLNSNSLPFSIDSSGRLRTTRPLDRETRSSYTFTLRVSDSCSGCALSATTTVRVTVTDVNDNPPIFTSNPNTVEVSEDLPLNTAVAEYRATDADIGSNAAITFTLTPNTVPFSISSTGTLSLTGSIDYETTQSYSIVITASNPGTSLVTRTNTTIQILNVNDNTPVITGEPIVATVQENSAIGTLVTTVTATDGDLGIHGDIRYFIISGNINNTFAMNSITGALTVIQNIDREMISSFSLVIRSQDRGTPQTRRDMTTITITVSDVNDNAPIFRPNSYPVQLREDLPVGQNVVRVIATDADQPDTPNSNIAYAIIGGNTGSSFRILNNGQIQSNQMLDFETTSSYRLVVEGRDGGSPVRSATATVLVTVINVNENPPTLTGDQSVNISESAPVGSTIAVFQAQDQDQMAITINIISGNSAGTFSIDSTTGVITLVSGLDYESTTSYSLTIRASDGEQNTDSSLMVNVLDENEFNPVFSGQSNFMIAEESLAGTTVGTVIATDEDRNDEITYEFVGQNVASEKFILNSRTGVITTSRILDRETLTQVFSPPLSQVTLQVAATDNGSPSRQSFRDYTITLTDINDNTPTFSDTKYTNQLRENLPPGQVVFTTSATDTDLGTNAQITYSFTLSNNQGSSNPFQINSATGIITTTMPLDCELQPFYLFSITATDAGSPPMSSTVIGNLTLIDENDNSPQFSQSIYFETVSESLTPGTTIMTFLATDADKGLNGEVQYYVETTSNNRFIEGEEDVEFMIDISTGRFYAINSFDYERDSQVNVTVFANDRGLPRRTTSALLVISVTNVDEDPPFFLASICSTSITTTENVAVGTTIGYCTAIDQDTIATGSQSSITYSSNNQIFSINSTSGAITTKAPLDRESSNSVIGLDVQATDLANQVASREIRVFISDVNDNAPQFQSTPYNYYFTDSAIRSNLQEFMIIQATDPDSGNNGTFTFRIGNIIKLTETETKVQVIAQDIGVPSLSSSVNVTVTFQSPCQLQLYTVSNNNGEGHLSAELLCSVVVTSPSMVLTLGMTDSLTCRIIRNTIAEFQWLHNGTSITNSKIVQSDTTDVTLALNNIRFSNAGQYACKASSDAGSLQSVAQTATIQVTPIIIVLPQDTSAEKGGTASFKCTAVGIPTPTVEWFVGTRPVGSGNTLSIPNVNASNATVYTCGVSNNAGTTTASARLVVFDKFSVVQIELTNIDNPSSDGSCQYFDPSQLTDTINSITKQRVVVTTTSGSNLCELSPCSPSPCQNGSTCALKDVVGGYECTCQSGYTGVNCTLDVDECSQSPCGDNGACTNTRGSFRCACNQNYTGRTCQFEKTCSPDLCSGSGQLCLEVYSGYECKAVNPMDSVVVTGASVTAEKLSDLVQVFIDEALQASSSGTTSTSRRRRQVVTSSLNTSCQPNFVTHEENSLILLWTSCPVDEGEPTSLQQQMLCSYFFGMNVVAQCKSPNGETVILPTAATPSPTSVKVNLVFVDENNKPIDAVTSVKTLQDKAIQEALATSGITVANVAVLEPAQETQNSNSESNLNAALGGSIGGILGLALLAVVIIITVVMVKKRAEIHKEHQRIKRERAQQMLHLDAGEFNTMKKVSTIASTASTENLIDSSDSPDYDVLPPLKTSRT